MSPTRFAPSAAMLIYFTASLLTTALLAAASTFVHLSPSWSDASDDQGSAPHRGGPQPPERLHIYYLCLRYGLGEHTKQSTYADFSSTPWGEPRQCGHDAISSSPHPPSLLFSSSFARPGALATTPTFTSVWFEVVVNVRSSPRHGKHAAVYRNPRQVLPPFSAEYTRRVRAQVVLLINFCALPHRRTSLRSPRLRRGTWLRSQRCTEKELEHRLAGLPPTQTASRPTGAHVEWGSGRGQFLTESLSAVFPLSVRSPVKLVVTDRALREESSRTLGTRRCT